MLCRRRRDGRRKVTGQGLTVLEALILGVVQGVTEFLPVSSSAHLVIVPQLFNIPAPTVAFDVLLHVATLIAVVGYFIGDVSKIVTSLVAPKRLGREEVRHWRRLFAWLVIGSVPAAVIGAALSGFFEDLFSSTAAVGIFLVVTSCLLWGADFATARADRAKRQGARLDKMSAARCPGRRLLPGPRHRSRSEPVGLDHRSRHLPGLRPADRRPLRFPAQHPRDPRSFPLQAPRPGRGLRWRGGSGHADGISSRGSFLASSPCGS